MEQQQEKNYELISESVTALRVTSKNYAKSANYSLKYLLEKNSRLKLAAASVKKQNRKKALPKYSSTFFSIS